MSNLGEKKMEWNALTKSLKLLYLFIFFPISIQIMIAFEESPEFSRRYILWNDQNPPPPPHWDMNLAEELRPHEFSSQMGKIQVKMTENLKKLTDVR